MSSLLTNSGASVALQTLKSITSEISTVQAELSTGRKVSGSEDNAAVWAIATRMEADVAGYAKVSASLALGSATVAVARSAAETITELLTDIKGKVIAAQEENVDRTKIQSNIDALREQIGVVVEMAQFNGLDLLTNTDTTVGSGREAILGFLQRDSAGVREVDIHVARQDLGTGASAVSATGGTFSNGVASATLSATKTATIDASAVSVVAGQAFSLNVFGTDADGSGFAQADLRTSAANSQTQSEMAASEITYVARDGDTASDVMRALASRFTGYATSKGIERNVLSITASGRSLNLTSSVTSAADQIAVSLTSLSADAGNTIGGGLELLAGLDVTSEAGADLALSNLDSLIEVSISAAAGFGSAQNRLATQSAFNDMLVDAMKSGIGTLVDANLEQASARLQALQVQQQLAAQALAIANSAPSNILSLFR
ncbi:flagellin [Citreicella sp. C3M06]|uniref:flagellin N-terminal helical domain-containing protein n=1 Tax=Citreicella sp. C3M06 TaxID=2841564 RepID=UPI001C094BE7|nr:flagellin [Citreicella sp. C3M06]MBU2962972.1 flagellin [Citreicella sp. C3M06]